MGGTGAGVRGPGCARIDQVVVAPARRGEPAHRREVEDVGGRGLLAAARDVDGERPRGAERRAPTSSAIHAALGETGRDARDGRAAAATASAMGGSSARRKLARSIQSCCPTLGIIDVPDERPRAGSCTRGTGRRSRAGRRPPSSPPPTSSSRASHARRAAAACDERRPEHRRRGPASRRTRRASRAATRAICSWRARDVDAARGATPGAARSARASRARGRTMAARRTGGREPRPPRRASVTPSSRRSNATSARERKARATRRRGPGRASAPEATGASILAFMRMHVYIDVVADVDALLRPSGGSSIACSSEPARLRLLALAAEEELSIGELAELLGESQPNVSRHAAALRQAGLLRDRREGTRTLVRVARRGRARRRRGRRARRAAGRSASATGACARVARGAARARGRGARVLRAARRRRGSTRRPPRWARTSPRSRRCSPRRGARARRRHGRRAAARGARPGLRARRRASTASEAQLAARARARRGARLRQRDARRRASSTSKDAARAPSGGGADAVFASRVLHHAPQPGKVVAPARGALRAGRRPRRPRLRAPRRRVDARAGRRLARLRAARAAPLRRAAGLEDVRVTKIPAPLCGDGPDRHLPWQVMVAETKRRDTNDGNGHERESTWLTTTR